MGQVVLEAQNRNVGATKRATESREAKAPTTKGETHSDDYEEDCSLCQAIVSQKNIESREANDIGTFLSP